ncbi:MAG: response regulator [Bdellovibrionota bacterium]
MFSIEELLAERARMQKLIDLLAIASQEIGSSLDYAETQRRSVKLAVSVLAESAFLLAIDREGELKVASFAHVDPSQCSALGNELSENFDAVLAKWQVRETIRLGEALHGLGPSPTTYCVPIRERGEITAVLCFETARPEGFPQGDRGLIAEFVERIGIALANAKLYENLRAVENELLEAKRRAEDESRAKSNFLATMSHEIRTPLGAILGFSELLIAQQPAHAESEEFASRIRANGEHLMRLIDEILNFAKVEAGKIEIEMREIDLMLLLSNLAAVSRSTAERKGIGFSLSFRSPVPATFVSDPTRLNQVLSNLVSNAIKFTNVGKVELSVEFKEASKCLMFSVRDSGPGLNERQAQKLFMPFSQADASHTRLFGGTGIGLALARKLGRLLGGDVELLESQEGLGSTFQLGLPVSIPQGTPFVSSLTIPARAPQEEVPISSLASAKILLVDDSEDNRRLVARLLSGAGAIVKTATNGFEAIEAAMSESFAVVLMDMQMPGMDGLTATRELRTRRYDRPIISLTAHVLEEERRECLRAGCDAHLTKPVKKSELLWTVGEWVSRRHNDAPAAAIKA